LRLGGAGYCLTRDHQFTFLQISFKDFGLRSIAQAHLDAARLQLSVLTHHPNHPCLSGQHRSAGGREVTLPILLSRRTGRLRRTACVRLSLPSLPAGILSRRAVATESLS
jgi:hypothetical protein